MTPEIIQQLANLSMLEITAEQQPQTKQALESIFSLINQLQNIDTTNVKPLSFPLDILTTYTQPLRIDEAKSYNISDTMQKNAPNTQEQFYLVPKVID